MQETPTNGSGTRTTSGCGPLFMSMHENMICPFFDRLNRGRREILAAAPVSRFSFLSQFTALQTRRNSRSFSLTTVTGRE